MIPQHVKLLPMLIIKADMFRKLREVVGLQKLQALREKLLHAIGYELHRKGG